MKDFSEFTLNEETKLKIKQLQKEINRHGSEYFDAISHLVIQAIISFVRDEEKKNNDKQSR